MIARFLLDSGLGRFSFDYLGPPWAFIAVVSLLIVILVLFRSLLKGLK
jgi:ABC-type polysaccharide/polyol phosphate export permease